MQCRRELTVLFERELARVTPPWLGLSAAALDVLTQCDSMEPAPQIQYRQHP